jgi:predicted O-linked N-acetylglucosamine transferase (SPINDLY family)
MSPLRRRMIEDLQIRNMAAHTQRAYVEQVVRFGDISANRLRISDQLRSGRIWST